MAISIECPDCRETESLTGVRGDEEIDLTCGACGATWSRSLAKRCGSCGGDDVQTVPLAIVERSRGTQLSVVGTRPIDLCSRCDGDKLRRYHANRPNPLMPDALPTVGEEQMNG